MLGVSWSAHIQGETHGNKADSLLKTTCQLFLKLSFVAGRNILKTPKLINELICTDFTTFFKIKCPLLASAATNLKNNVYTKETNQHVLRNLFTLTSKCLFQSLQKIPICIFIIFVTFPKNKLQHTIHHFSAALNIKEIKGRQIYINAIQKY